MHASSFLFIYFFPIEYLLAEIAVETFPQEEKMRRIRRMKWKIGYRKRNEMGKRDPSSSEGNKVAENAKSQHSLRYLMSILHSYMSHKKHPVHFLTFG